MKNVLYLLSVVLFAACSKDDEAEVIVSDADIEVYQQVFDDALSYIEADTSIDINTTVEFVKKLEGVTNVVVEDSIVRVAIQGGVNFTIDFYEHPDDYSYDSFNESAFQSYLDSIDNATDNKIPSGYEKTDEVFKDYLSAITRSVGIPGGEGSTRASSTNQRVRLTRRNAAIWAPLGGGYQEESNRIIKIANSTLANDKRKMRVLQGFSPTVFSSFSEYDIVYFSYHGDKDGVISIPSRMLTQEERIKYKEEVKQKRVEKRIRVKDSKRYIDRYVLLDAFWEKYLPDLTNTIIFSCVCYLGVDNSHFLKVCKKKNVADFFAADDECRAKKIVECFEKFYPLFMRGNCSTRTAFEPFRDFFFYEGLGYTFNYKRFGTKTVYYITSHVTGVGNRTTNSSRATRSSSNDNSYIIVNAQLRYAAEESDDILKTIEAGICLQDMETKQVTLIPFSDKNIVSNEKKDYGNVTVSNIAASLGNLTDEHQYAYCCYTKVDGVVTLSDECYKFSKTQNYVLRLSIPCVQQYIVNFTSYWTGSNSWTYNNYHFFGTGRGDMLISKTNGYYEFDIWCPRYKRDLEESFNSFEFILNSNNPNELQENPKVENTWGRYSYKYHGYSDYSVTFSRNDDNFMIDVTFVKGNDSYNAHIQLTNLDANPKATFKCIWDYDYSSREHYNKVYEFESIGFEYSGK